jgi:hypothetical protein
VGEGNKPDMNDVPLVERRKSPLFPPMQALALYLVSMVIGAVLIYQWTERAEGKVETAKAQAAYESCLGSVQILETGNDQAEVLREVVRTIADGRRATAEMTTVPEEKALALAHAGTSGSWRRCARTPP